MIDPNNDFDVEKLDPSQVPIDDRVVKGFMAIMPTGEVLADKLRIKIGAIKESCEILGLSVMIAITRPSEDKAEPDVVICLLNSMNIPNTSHIIDLISDFDNCYHGDAEYLEDLNRRINDG